MNDTVKIIIGIVLPLLGTSAGAAMVFLMKGEMKPAIQKLLLGFASGVMIAASVWSLLIPSIEMASDQGQTAWFPAVVGFLLGIGFLLLLDSVIPHLHVNADRPEGKSSRLGKSAMLVLAVTLHNIPEGKAKRIRDNSKTIIHTSSSGKKGITVTLGKSPVWPFFCFCIKQ
ncbi:MAG: ZIP family metal transporter, partial [Acutalibacteraceae bacterium]